MTTPVVIRHKAGGLYLTHWGAGFTRYSQHPAPFRSEGHAEMVIRIDIGADLDDFEIIDAETVPAGNRSGGRR